MSALAFVGVDEPTVDEVLDHLREACRLPARCLVFSSHVNRLAALVDQWRAQVEIAAAVVASPIADIADGMELIVENEGLDPTQVLWVGGGPDLEGLPRSWRRVVIDERGRSHAIAQAIVTATMRTAADPLSP